MGLYGFKKFGQTLGDGHRATVFNEAVHTFSSADRLVAYTHLIQKLKLHLRHLSDSDLNVNDILECGRTFIVTLNRDDRRKHAFSLDLLKAEPQLVELVHTGLFHETDIVGMMRHAHAVAFVVFHFVLVCMHYECVLGCKETKKLNWFWSVRFDFVILRP